MLLREKSLHLVIMEAGRLFMIQLVYSVAKENTAWNDISCWDNKMFHEQTERAGLTVLEFHPNSVPFQWGVSIGEKHGSFHVLLMIEGY